MPRGALDRPWGMAPLGDFSYEGSGTSEDLTRPISGRGNTRGPSEEEAIVVCVSGELSGTQGEAKQQSLAPVDRFWMD